MTDPHARAGVGHELAAPGEPGRDRGRWQFAEVGSGGGPPGQDLELDLPVPRRELPIGSAGHDSVPDALEASHGKEPRLRTERRTKTLVAALVPIHRGNDLQIEWRSRIKHCPTLVGERRIDRQAA